ncbi:MAG: efflux RND transporter periplasmic adaptor subunit [Chloroflexota bacterium]
MIAAVTATGRIEPADRVGLTFDTPGIVAEVYVLEGDRVESGAALGKLLTQQLKQQVAQSEAALAAAEAQLAQLRERPRQSEIGQARANVRAAEARVGAAAANFRQLADGPSEAEVASAAAQLAQAMANEEVAQDTYDLIQEEGTQKEQANYDLFTAKQEVAAARARLEDVLTGTGESELRAAQANVSASIAQQDAAQAQLDKLLSKATEEEIAEAEAQVEQARIALELSRYALEKATLRAPFDGLVTKVNVSPGEMTPTQEPPFVLLDDSAFHITVAVDELDVSHVRPGQDVEVKVEALPEAAVTGTVERINPIASLRSGVVAYDVVIALQSTDYPLRADMTANVTVVVEELADVLKIPTWALSVDRDTGETYVHRRTGDEIERVSVALGIRQDGIAQVVSGLSAGDEVVQLDENASFTFDLQ